ncbi:fumarylacetoacetate hydrolase family protein [Marinomonas mediterranea]|jgi:2-keto-4-pentenoate hydratase/2-oxohepta-3-ene-1,7-dioic acid hydratase (catechol pathway)|uniref:Fumarylacetoacetate (FAA) hydrolase n=1 Tax=Marinomonas mediterranea (strain ATCC 700492 / JCM 21426 / NBRC 103028 / MMB-1) TaxID=717774 RepID=F2K2D9_MARM1|nr:fumarylacetoacetate hydrolase family protein [Marinomonas mediterranea]ADZ92319.1 fumarylacetoacetate (FAA) hydrolase [Marinomonas mediterranea MMB-1]WCN10271.1 fumarylacetoacetate hydrolase [Marinomonas mediterranea]WCN14318.1 fumarylacetoacetate hydrolase [Marinomonas mediterranea]WCN18370.1 fumarylacetoacetate hydrolase [Marinomonas mediterranea MMB-1]
MKLATIKNGHRDGRLAIVSRDLTKAVYAGTIVDTMIEALENWHQVETPLRNRYALLNKGCLNEAFDFDPIKAMAPLPRCYQFVDASAFLNHGNIMEQAYNLDVKKEQTIPILVQRQSDDFLGARDDYTFPSEADNADFEGEFAVIVDDMPMGIGTEEAENHIKLVLTLNDMSMRTHLFRELQMGFGFINAKPATAFSPVAVTPDELGDAWHNGRVCLNMDVTHNGVRFGNPNGREMDFSFGQILSHLAYNRNLKAGAIIGSGTVSNTNWKEVGSACLAERRALELIEYGECRTEFLKYGDRLTFDVKGTDGRSVFGSIEHTMMPS